VGEDAAAGAAVVAGGVVAPGTATGDGPDPDGAGVVTGVAAAVPDGAAVSGVWPARDAGTVVGTVPGWLLAGGTAPAAPRALPAGGVVGVGESVGGISNMVGAVVVGVGVGTVVAVVGAAVVGVGTVVAVDRGAAFDVGAGTVPVGAGGVDAAGALEAAPVDGSATEIGDEDLDGDPGAGAPPAEGEVGAVVAAGPTRIMVGAEVPPTVAAQLGVALTRGPERAASPTVQATSQRVPGSEIRSRNRGCTRFWERSTRLKMRARTAAEQSRSR
jgi:hypothetical protein